MTDKLIVTRERHEIEVLARPRIRGHDFCAGCQLNVRWLIPEEVMALTRTSMREVFRQVEQGVLHCTEVAGGFVVICARSLAAEMREKAVGELK